MATEGANTVGGYKLSLALVVLAAATSKVILLQGLSVDSLAAFDLTGKTEVSTFPATASQLGNFLGAVPAAMLMARLGRRRGFLVGGALYVGGGLLGVLAMRKHSFPLQLLSVASTGIGYGFSEYLRFAAAEIVPAHLKARAVSLTIASSVVSGVVGPQIAKSTASMFDTEFEASYLANGIIGLLYLLIIACIPNLPSVVARRGPRVSDDMATARGPIAATPWWQMFTTHPALMVATLSCGVGYCTMILTMTATPIAMKAQGFGFEDTATTIQAHAVCMFAPGFVTGEVIAKLGEPAVMLVGTLMLLSHSATALAGTGRWHFGVALMFSGVGWNFLYTAGSALLVASLPNRVAQAHTHAAGAAGVAASRTPGEETGGSPSPAADTAKATAEGTAEGTAEAAVAVTLQQERWAVAQSSESAQRLQVQGVNEAVVRALSVLAATCAGLLLRAGGWELVQLVATGPAIVTLAVVGWFAFSTGTCCTGYTPPATTGSHQVASGGPLLLLMREDDGGGLEEQVDEHEQRVADDDDAELCSRGLPERGDGGVPCRRGQQELEQVTLQPPAIANP